MSILKEFEVMNGHERRPDPFRKPAIVLLEAERIEIGEPQGWATQDRYVLRAQLGVEFWCNRAQYNNALKTARKVMLHRVYGPLLGALHELRQAVYDYDIDAAFACIDKMEKEMLDD